MMATHVGIELSPAACRIVEVDGGGPSWRRGGDLRVRSFAVLPPSGADTRAKLKSLRRREASVIVWGGRSEHRQVMVTAGSYESMRAEALESLSSAGLTTGGVWADITPATPADDRAARRPVVVSMASAADLSAAIRPLKEAGIRIRTVTTPAVALGSLARMRRALSVPGVIESYVAIDEQVTCISLVRNGVLVAARDLPWGFIDESRAHSETRSREDMTARLAGAIGEFVIAIGASPRDIGQVCVCGGLIELRSMAASLMERLDVEVEPLDSLFGIDAARLPAPADEFRERAAELRLAWAVAADWPPVINLLRARRQQVSKTWLARAAVVAGATAGLTGSWWVVARSHLGPGSGAAPVTGVAVNTAARGRGPATTAQPKPGPVGTGRVMTPPPTAVNKAPAVTPSPVVVNEPPVATSTLAVNKRPVPTPPAIAVNKPPAVTPPVAVNKPMVVMPPASSAASPAVVTPQPVATKPPAATPPAVVNKAPAGPQPQAVVTRPRDITPPTAAVLPRPRSEPAPARVRPAAPPEVPLPFDAVLGTILYSSDRKLAIIDNRIVGVGDEVRGARVTDITSSAVLLRDVQGRLRRLSLSVGGR